MRKLLSQFELGDMLITYMLSDTNNVGVEIIPCNIKDRIVKEKQYEVDSLVQLKLAGEDFPFGFVNGHSMRNSESVYKFTYDSQCIERNEEYTAIITSLKTKEEHKVIHTLTYHNGYSGVEVVTEYINESHTSITLEMLSSFSIGGLTPFAEGDGHNTMNVHRLRSKWSNEARIETISVEDLQLEPTWSGYGAYSEKFGQKGSMPVRGFFPFVAVEDTQNHVTWGVQIGCASSWQMEVYRRDNGLVLSGGLPDYDFGHWCKTFEPGERMTTPTAYITVCQGNVDEACRRLTGLQERAFKKIDQFKKLPIIFNEFCTTWGKPSHENISRILDKIKGKDFNYFVIDAGWYSDEIKGWEMNMGDWQVNPQMFPQGLEATVQMIKDAGLIPGIWFEMEICGRDAKAFQLEPHLLKRKGKVITTGNRRFWDMRDKFTINYLSEKVIGFLKRYDFKYLKVDYNDSLGIGCDDKDSLGEGLRQNILASQEFFRKIRREIPDIVIENCSSGGHRLEPSMMALCDMASFSDAHEEKEIPIIAANLHRAILPAQSQIWAVLREKDTPERLVYSLINTFLGVMCLSGDIYDLDKKQWEIIEEGMAFYNKISHLIKDGITTIHGPKVTSYRHPQGWQAVVRSAKDTSELLVLIHTFGGSLPKEIIIDLEEEYRIDGIYSANDREISCDNHSLKVSIKDNFEAIAVHLQG